MRVINLEAIANQELSVRLDGSLYDIRIKEANGVMVADISRDSNILILGTRIVAGVPILPYKYQEKDNFILLTENDEIPYYTLFASTQSLIYLTIAEVATYGQS